MWYPRDTRPLAIRAEQGEKTVSCSTRSRRGRSRADSGGERVVHLRHGLARQVRRPDRDLPRTAALRPAHRRGLRRARARDGVAGDALRAVVERARETERASSSSRTSWRSLRSMKAILSAGADDRGRAGPLSLGPWRVAPQADGALAMSCDRLETALPPDRASAWRHVRGRSLAQTDA